MAASLSQLQALAAVAEVHRAPNGEVEPCPVEPEVFDALWDQLQADPVSSRLIDFFDDPVMRTFKFNGVLFARKEP